jgi:glycosyltransferase involved in cell wall biosynthesis
MVNKAPRPKISVVTITLNRKSFLNKSIESVIAQNYENIEHIVIDGGSTDGTLELLRTYTHLTWISEPDAGQADAMNKGIARASGDIFAWLNSDDTYPPGTFSVVAKYFMEDPALALLAGRCRIVGPNYEVLGYSRYHKFDLPRLMLAYNNVNTPAVFTRLDIVKQVGQLDCSLKATYDLDLWIRVAQRGKARAAEEILSNLCLHPGSGLISTRAHVAEAAVIRQRYAKHLGLWDRLFRAAIFRVSQWVYDVTKFRAFARAARKR